MSEIITEKKIYIYALVDPFDFRIRYIGKSINPEKRLKNHLYQALRGHTRRDHWIRSVLSHDATPYLLMLEEVEDHNWEEKESFYILLYKSDGLTNHTSGGDGVHQLDSESKERLSNARKQLYNNAEFRERMLAVCRSPDRCSKISNSLQGKKKTPEHIAKLPQNKPGRKLTPEQKQKIKDNCRGHRWSPEEIKLIQESNKGNKYGLGHKSRTGQKQSEEEKREKSIALKGRQFTPEHKEKIRQALLKSWAKRKGPSDEELS